MTETTFDFDATYTVDGYGGVAWRAFNYQFEWTEEEWVYSGEGDEDDESSYFFNESEKVEDRSKVRCHMVGDDRTFVFDVDELTALDELDYCASCGQVGCTADGRER